MSTRPGTELSKRTLHFILVADCSGSMAADGKVQALNTAVREVMPHLASVASENPHVDLLFSALSFSTGVRWHVDPPASVEEVAWTDLRPGGYTDLGAALNAVAHRVTVASMGTRAMAPAIILVSDGQPTDDYRAGLQRLLSEPFGNAASRIAVAIGRDADRSVLIEFQGGGEPLMAHNPEQLVRSIRWASTAVTRAASEVIGAPGLLSPIPWDISVPGGDEVVW